jgi:hypothetical protein
MEYSVGDRSSHYNYVSETGQQYEEEFWKLKAKRMVEAV